MTSKCVPYIEQAFCNIVPIHLQTKDHSYNHKFYIHNVIKPESYYKMIKKLI